MNPSSYFIQFALLMVAILAVAFTDTTASSPPPNSDGTNNDFEFLGAVKPNQSIAEPPASSYAVISAILTIAGFVGNLISFYDLINSFVNPSTPDADVKNKLDNVLKTMDTEFNQVKNILDKMDKKLDQLLMQAYHDVEKSVSFALQDFKFNVSSDNLGDRPFTLHNRLDTFLKGMLGQGTLLPDLLLNLRDLYDCGTRSMRKKMEEFITMVNVGVACLSYYNKAIKNFNGDARVKDLEMKYEAVKIRLEKEISTCAPVDRSSKVHEYINQILSRNQADSVSPLDMTVLLYTRFGDVYPNHNWIFYTARKFNPVPKGGSFNDIKQFGSYYIEHDSTPPRGFHGITKNGQWTVFWVGHAVLEGDNTKDLRVDEVAMQNDFKEGWTSMLDYYFSGRTPVAYMVFIGPKMDAEAGNPRLANSLRPLNVWKKRMYTNFFIPWGGSVYPLPFPVDVVVM